MPAHGKRCSGLCPQLLGSGGSYRGDLWWPAQCDHVIGTEMESRIRWYTPDHTPISAFICKNDNILIFIGFLWLESVIYCVFQQKKEVPRSLRTLKDGHKNRWYLGNKTKLWRSLLLMVQLGDWLIRCFVDWSCTPGVPWLLASRRRPRPGNRTCSTGMCS